MLKEIWTRTVAPEPEEKPWQWCERNVSAIPYSPLPGGFDSSHDPAIREVIDAICDPAIPLVVIRCAVQQFKTLALELACAWFVKNDPAPTMFFQDIDENAKDEMQMRLRLLFDNTKGVKELIPSGADKDKAKTTSILFRNGMSLWVLGASNPRNLQRRSIRRVLMDECWQYPKDRGCIKQASRRVTAFKYLGKVVAASQGSDEGDEFDELWKTTNMAERNVACPKCGQHQPLDFFKGVQFEALRDEAGEYRFAEIAPTVRYECAHCQSEWPDTEETRRDLRETSRFVATNPNAGSGKLGLSSNALATHSWADLVEEYLRAKVATWKGDFGPLKLFHQQRLGMAWGEQGADDFTIEVSGSGYNIGDPWPDEGRIRVIAGKVGLIRGVLTNLEGTKPFRSIVADVQRECLWVTVRGWTVDGRTRLMWAGKLAGWNELAALQKQFDVAATMVFVDSGDKPGAEVYPQALERGWTCLRGDGAESFPHTIRPKDKNDKPKTVRRSYSTARKVALGTNKIVMVYNWSNLAIKDQLAKLLRMPDRWQTPDDIAQHCPDYLPQMDSERRTKIKGKTRWMQIGKRPNHIWDCFDSETEVLTEMNGFVKFADLSAEKLGTVNLETDLIEFQTPTNYISKNHDGEMISIEGRSASCLVTPSHRMVVYEKKFRNGKWGRELKIKRADELTIWDGIKVSAGWSGKNEQIKIGTDSFERKKLARVFGWFVAKGNLAKGGKVVFSQNKGRKRDMMENDLKFLGINWRPSGDHQIFATNHSLHHALKECGHLAENKRIPQWLKDSSVDVILEFLDAARLGDGWNQGKLQVWATVSKLLSDDYAEMILKTGSRCNIKSVEPKPYCIAGKSGTNTLQQFWPQKCSAKMSHLRDGANRPLFKKKRYSGTVYCATVPNGTLIVKRRGKIIIAGNCEAGQVVVGNMVKVLGAEIEEGKQENELTK